MDDISISGERVPKSLILEVKKVLNQYGLKSKASKEKHYYHKKAAEITGVIVKKNGELSTPSRNHLKAYMTKKRILKENNEFLKMLLELRLEGCTSQRRQVEKFKSEGQR